MDFNIIEKTEKKASELFDMFKIEDNVYCVCDCFFNTGSKKAEEFREKVGNPCIYFTENLIAELDKVIGEKGKTISIRLIEVLHEDHVTVQVLNLTTQESTHLRLKSTFDRNRRYMIAGLVANCTTRKDVNVGVYLFYSYEGLVELIKSEEEKMKHEV